MQSMAPVRGITLQRPAETTLRLDGHLTLRAPRLCSSACARRSSGPLSVETETLPRRTPASFRSSPPRSSLRSSGAGSSSSRRGTCLSRGMDRTGSASRPRRPRRIIDEQDDPRHRRFGLVRTIFRMSALERGLGGGRRRRRRTAQGYGVARGGGADGPDHARDERDRVHSQMPRAARGPRRARRGSDDGIRRAAEARGPNRRRDGLAGQAVPAGRAPARREEGRQRASASEAAAVFAQEAEELLESLEGNLLDLERGPTTPSW